MQRTNTSSASNPLRHRSIVGWMVSVNADRSNAFQALLLVAGTSGIGSCEMS